MMKIVYLTSRFPWPLDKGDKLRAYHQIRLLSMDFEVHLIAISSEVIPQESLNQLLKYCSSVEYMVIPRFTRYFNTLKALVCGKPLQVGYFYSSKASKFVNQHVESIKPDLVFAQLIRTVEYVKDLKIKKILDYQDTLSLGLKRRFVSRKSMLNPILKLEYRRLLQYEADAFGVFDSTMIISRPDLEHLPVSDKSRVNIIANGVDMQAFTSEKQVEKKFNLIFAGNMSYPPNIDSAIYLAREILPRVNQKMKGVTLLLAGANPTSLVKSLENEAVKVSGWIDDMVEAYSSADIFIAPMRIGTGLQNKLLEAMSVGLPVITSELANRALGAEPEYSIHVGSCPTDYADRIIYLLKNKEIRFDLAKNGHEFVKENYSWEKIGYLLNDLVKNIINK